MPRRSNGSSSLQQPASPYNQQVLSKFLKIRPKMLGVFEISIGLMLFIITIWTGFFYLLWWPLITILTGTVTVSAACTRNMCRVKISQFLNCFNAISAVISILLHCIATYGITAMFLFVCDTVIFIFSLTVASSTCECCRTKPRHVAVSYVNTAVPNVTVNNFVVLSQHGPYSRLPNYDSDPFAPPQNYTATPPSYSTVPSAPPPNYDPGLFAPPPNYSTVYSESPPNYSTLYSAPPPNFDSHSLNYCTVSSAPPPHYKR